MSDALKYSPQVLLLSSRYDFATDYVVAGLIDRRVPYLRLNSEDLPNLGLTLWPGERRLDVSCAEGDFTVTHESLRAVLYRRPVFLREASAKPRPIEEQLSRSQWAAFVRSMMMFDHSFWINHPGATYVAECKPVQLAAATEQGFAIPRTVVANTASFLDRGMNVDGGVIAKTLDSIVLSTPEQEAFIYSNYVPIEEVRSAELSSCPVIFQEFVDPKVDLRVTVVGSRVFAVEILMGEVGVRGDWRLQKDFVQFRPVELPSKVAERCVHLIQRLGLVFGAIDLAFSSGTYYFIEVNPTGEWAWLVDAAQLPIDQALSESLSQGAAI